MKTNLKLLRVKNKLTQLDMADMTNVTRSTYSDIENGKRSGSVDFWNKIQEKFDVPDEQMWVLMKNDKE